MGRKHLSRLSNRWTAQISGSFQLRIIFWWKCCSSRTTGREDIAQTLAKEPEGHRICCPTFACLRKFLDGMEPSDLPRQVEIIATDGIALRKPLELVMNKPTVAVVGRAKCREINACEPHNREARSHRGRASRCHKRPKRI